MGTIKAQEKKFLESLALDLIEYITPHGHEHILYPIIHNAFPECAGIDSHGNMMFIVGNKGNIDTMFTAHLDNVGTKVEKAVFHLDRPGQVIRGYGKTIIGADDKAGVTTLIGMMRAGVEGLYMLFAGEERGRVGSEAFFLSEKENLGHIKKVISFDRKATHSLITKQSGTKCVSEEFSNRLAIKLHLMLDDGGSYTDSATFMYDIPECTNISVGFYGEHTNNEIWHYGYVLDALLPRLVKIDFKSLPVVREPKPKVVYVPKVYENVYEEDDWEEWKDKRTTGKKWDVKSNKGTPFTKLYSKGYCAYCFDQGEEFYLHYGKSLCEKCISIFGDE
jgi:hypothetical protein